MQSTNAIDTNKDQYPNDVKTPTDDHESSNERKSQINDEQKTVNPTQEVPSGADSHQMGHTDLDLQGQSPKVPEGSHSAQVAQTAQGKNSENHQENRENQGTQKEQETQGTDKTSKPKIEYYRSVEDLLYGDQAEVRFVKKDETNKKILVRMYSRRSSAPCPECGTLCPCDGGGFSRTLQDVPLIPTYTTFVVFHGRKCSCTNPDCSKKSFEEPVPFADTHARRTVRANIFLIIVTIMLSFFSSMKILKLLGFDVSHDTIRNLFHNPRYLHFEDDPDVVEIGVDDVANRKGVSYFTIIYRLRDHAPLAILDGRDGKSLRVWLLAHPKVNKVMRDRASAYAAVVDEVCGELCIQVADRFHLIQNIIDHLKDLLNLRLPVAFAFRMHADGTAEMLDKVPSKVVKIELRISDEEFKKLYYDNTPYVDADGNLVIVNARTTDPSTQQSKRDAESRMAKYLFVKEVRELYNTLDLSAMNLRKNASKITVIAQQVGKSRETIKKYVSMTDEEVEALKDVRPTKDYNSKFEDYKNIGYKMLLDGYDIETITLYIKNQGCELADLTIVRRLESIQRHHFPERPCKMFSSLSHSAEYPEDVVVFSRTQVERQIFTTHDEKLDKDLAKVMPLIMERYPVCADASCIYTDFHAAIMGNDPDALDGWIAKYRNGILPRFVESVNRDIIPIKNAIKYPESSGFVEGNNNKFKLIKRIFYGRSGQKNLEIRFLLACLFTKEGFDLSDVCPFLKYVDLAA